MAAFCCAETRRSAMRLRRRVIGTRRSSRSPGSGAGIGAALGASLLASPPEDCLRSSRLARAFSTSSLVMRPSRPLPLTSDAERLCSLIILRAAGPAWASLSPPCSSFSGVPLSSAAGASFSSPLSSSPLSFAASLSSSLPSPLSAPPAPLPASSWPSTSWLSTVSPSSLMIFATTPSLGATTSSTTLSVSMSTSSSSRLTASPSFLCQVATVPSATDSGNCGALMSVAMLIP